MTASIWESIADTPWWMYLGFIGLFALSWSATKPREIPIRNLLATPLVFIPFSLLCISFTLPINALNIGIWVVTAALGTVLGWWQFRLMKIKAIKDKLMIHMPGTRSLFIFMFLISAAKYFYGFSFSDYLALFTQVKYAKPILGGYGLLTGLLIGKVFYCLRCVKVGPFLSHT
jgi:hypothetical protein